MNVAIRALTQSNVSVRTFGNVWALMRTHMALLILSGAVLFSSFGLVYVKDTSRCWMANLQELDMHYKQLRNQESQLLLEESAWTAATRVHQIAAKQLGMVMPKAKSIVLVHSV